MFVYIAENWKTLKFPINYKKTSDFIFCYFHQTYRKEIIKIWYNESENKENDRKGLPTTSYILINHKLK